MVSLDQEVIFETPVGGGVDFGMSLYHSNTWLRSDRHDISEITGYFSYDFQFGYTVESLGDTRFALGFSHESTYGSEKTQPLDAITGDLKTSKFEWYGDSSQYYLEISKAF